MRGFLPLKARDVNSLTVIVLLLFLSFSSRSQSLNTAKVTCSFKSASFVSVIGFLSDATGVYFVYSSNKIKVTEPVSLVVKDVPLSEALAILGDQLSLSFKVEGRHVMILAETAASAKQSQGALDKASAKKSSHSVVVRFDSPLIKQYFPPAPPRTSELFPSNEFLRKSLNRLQPYFDTAYLRNIPTHYIRRLNQNDLHGGMYISIGPTISDYSSGLEIQAGIRSVYAVFSPSWLRSTTFHGAYGLGLSLDLRRNFSINPVYTFATMSKVETEQISSKFGIAQFQIDTKTKHHQIKLMLQYAFPQNFNIKIGPTFNQSTLTYSYPEPDIMVLETYEYRIIPAGRPIAGTTNHFYATKAVTRMQDTQITKFWVGWEASLNIKINILAKP